MNLFTWSTIITIDQIESSSAFVEWENEALSVIPLQWLPKGVTEGQQLKLIMMPTRHSSCHITQDSIADSVWLDCAPAQSLYLPKAPSWSTKQAVIWEVTPINTATEKNRDKSSVLIALLKNTVYSKNINH